MSFDGVAYMKAHLKQLSAYVGEWVIVEGEDALFHGENQWELLKEYEKLRPGKVPSILKVPTVTFIPWRDPTTPFRKE